MQRREEIRGMCAEPARGGTQGAKQIFDLRDAINELFAHIDALEQTAAERVIADGKARAVVVPELPKFDPAWELSYRGKVASEKEQQAFANGYQFAMHKAEEAFRSARAILADRVPGEGMAALRRFAERCAQRDHQPDEHIGSAKCVACEAEDALRANQVGANE